MLGHDADQSRQAGLTRNSLCLGQTSLGASWSHRAKRGRINSARERSGRFCFVTSRRFPGQTNRRDEDYEALVARLSLYRSSQIGLDLPLDVRGNGLQRRVWQALRNPGRPNGLYTGNRAADRSPTGRYALFASCAANNSCGGIPCHRVVRNDGALSGYAWGLSARKHCSIANGARNPVTVQCRNVRRPPLRRTGRKG